VPDVFVEMGNGANRADAARLTSSKGQLDHAMAITTGLAAYLMGTHPNPFPLNLGPVTDFSAAPRHAAVGSGTTSTDTATNHTATNQGPDPDSSDPVTATDPGPGGAGFLGTTQLPGLIESVVVSAAQWARPLLSVLGVDLPDVSDLVGRVAGTLADLLTQSQQTPTQPTQ
jgi:hypothetical protein